LLLFLLDAFPGSSRQILGYAGAFGEWELEEAAYPACDEGADHDG
jgi:hypothetical protein